jgi:hypothetical protein
VAEVSNDKTVAPQRGNDIKTIAENTQATQSSAIEAGYDQTAISTPVPVTEKIAANTMVSQPNQANVVNDQEIVDADIIQRNIALSSSNHDILFTASSNHQIDKAPIVAPILSGSSAKVHHVLEYVINSGPIAGTGQKINTEPNPGSNKIERNENAGSSSMADYISYNHFLQDISLIILAGIVFIGILGFYRRREIN